MTNNDELALKLKKEITLANMLGIHPALSTLTADEISSLLAERDADKKRIEMLEKYVNERDAQNQDLLLNIGGLQQRIAELETVCAESYQVVGALADAAGVFETSEAVSKALDNLSDAKLTHEDVLPFAVEARTVSVPTFEEWCQMEGIKPLGWVREAMKEAYDGCRAAAGINLDVGDQP